MPIKVTKQGDDLDDLYTAEVIPPPETWRSRHLSALVNLLRSTPPPEAWKSPYPMSSYELGRKLLSVGCDPMEIRHALKEAGVGTFSSGTREAAKRIRPLLRAALAGEREVPGQGPSSEAWLAYSLPTSDTMFSLIEVISSANWINDGVPNADQISWAFLRLRKRGWLAIDGEMFGLTPEGKRAIKEIEGGNSRWPSNLVKWFSDHPLPGDE